MIALLELLKPTLSCREIHECCRRGSWLRFVCHKVLIELPRLLPDDQRIQQNVFLVAVADPNGQGRLCFHYELITTCHDTLCFLVERDSNHCTDVLFIFMDGANGRLIQVLMAGNLHNFLAIFDHIQDFHLLLDGKHLPLVLSFIVRRFRRGSTFRSHHRA
uniref:Uncharacterized protein n=1 Tax=Molossus molossus TaxID=27622 RepID=A0A7J8HI60_MOLMO|nr:hypothetical protein HJG59_010994 [Molossus molossus]